MVTSTDGHLPDQLAPASAAHVRHPHVLGSSWFRYKRPWAGLSTGVAATITE